LQETEKVPRSVGIVVLDDLVHRIEQLLAGQEVKLGVTAAGIGVMIDSITLMLGTVFMGWSLS